MLELDRLAGALRAIVRELFPRMDYLGAFEYQVTAVSGGLLDLHPTNESLGLPELSRVAMVSGVAGASMKPAIGSLAVVSFLNADPSKPYVLGYSPSETDKITLDNGSANVARVGDTVSGGVLKFNASGLFESYQPPGAPTPLPGPVVILSGSIQTGAAKVFA